ncbi:hypothetical protein [Streptomyces antibioticus]|uniref:hypothetical protein n=1 Tax=Streptomyces antibioticus TaxID=1890 RepID=UPI0036F6DD7F
MTTRADADPRIGALLDLSQALIRSYGELASSVIEYLPEGARAELVEHVQVLMREARGRYEEIALMGFDPPAGQYVLSTRPAEA